MKHYLADQHDRAHAAKRGAGHVPISLEAGPSTETTAELQIPDSAGPVPDTVFDRQWALTLVDRAVSALAAEQAANGKAGQFAALKPWLLGDVAPRSHADAARQLGLSEGAVKVAVQRLRKRFRELVKAEIAQTVNGANEVKDELRYLVETLSHQA